MVFGFDPDEDQGGRSHGPPAPPGWLPWLQLAFSTMLGVLFVVTLIRARDLSQGLRQLDQRLRVLEGRQSIESSRVLEDQLQSMVDRLQKLEQQATELGGIREEKERIERELSELRDRSGSGSALPPALPPSEAPRALPDRLPAPPARGGAGPARLEPPPVLRPPAQGSF